MMRLLICVLVLPLLLGGWAKSPWTMTADFGHDTGQNLGTLVEFLDAKGDVVCGAGFAASTQTRAIAAGRTLEFFCRTNGVPTIEDLGPVSPQTWRPMLAPWRDTVVELSTGFRKVGAEWVRDERFERRLLTQDVAGHLLSVGYTPDDKSTEVTADGRTILNIGSRARGTLYYRGHLYVATVDHTLTVCRWRPGDTTCSDARIIPHEPVGTVYAMIGYGDDVYFGVQGVGSRPEQLMRLRAGRIEVIYSNPPAAQVYSFLIRGDEILFGDFPRGEIRALNPATGAIRLAGDPPDAEVNLFFPKHAYGRDWTFDRYREAQSLALAGGRVFVGMYPWGRLYWSRDLREWSSHRLAASPAVDDQAGYPFRAELERRILEMRGDKQFAALMEHDTYPSIATWGQRVSALVVSPEGLLAGVGNMSGLGYDPAGRDSYLSRADLAPYGRIHRIRVPGSAMMALDWPDDEVGLTFTIDETSARLTINGEELHLDGLSLPPIVKARCGQGVFGPSPIELKSGFC